MTSSPPNTAVGVETGRVAFAYILSATIWLLVGTIAGLLVAIKLNWPDAFATQALSFGRLRPIHTNTVFWGWASMALSGLALYVVARTSRRPLYSVKAAHIALWLMNLAVVAGIVTLSSGWTRGPQEYREWIFPVAALFLAGTLTNTWNVYKTIAHRQVDEIYVSNWYILGAFCWIPIICIIGYLPWFDSGISNTVVQGYYMHNGVGMWFTPLALGITYYSLPRLLSKPIYSYALGALGFWTNLMFYTLIGSHHFIFSPIPWWLQTAAILFSIGMMVPVWAGTGNFFLTMRGSWDRVRSSGPLLFVFVGVACYALSSTQGSAEALKSANEYWHFTNFTVGHSHVAMYGFITFIIWGAIYGLVPLITEREPNRVLVGVHFWTALVGVAVYVTSISIAGVLQGLSWIAEESFISSVERAEPMWLWRSIGGVLMVASHFVFLVNVAAMRPRPEDAPEPTEINNATGSLA